MLRGRAAAVNTEIFIMSVKMDIGLSLLLIKKNLNIIAGINKKLQLEVMSENERGVVQYLISASERAQERGKQYLHKALENQVLKEQMDLLTNHDRQIADFIKQAKECLAKLSLALDKRSMFLSLEEYAQNQNSIPGQNAAEPSVGEESAFSSPRSGFRSFFYSNLVENSAGSDSDSLDSLSTPKDADSLETKALATPTRHVRFKLD